MYKTYSCAVIDKTGFTPTENALLCERNVLWNNLVECHNELLKKQEDYLFFSHPQAVIEVKESRKIPVNQKSRINTMIRSWFEAVKAEKHGIIRLYDDYIKECKNLARESGIWWPNRDKLWHEFINAHRSQIKMARPLSKRNTDSQIRSGWFTFRLQKIVCFDDFLRSEDGAVQIRKLSEDKYRLRLAIAKSNGPRSESIYTECDFIASKLPEEDEYIHSVTLFGVYNQNGWHGKVNFLTLAKDAEPTPNTIVVGLDVGWRMGEADGLLCLTASFGNGVYRRLHLPPSWVGRWQYAEDLSKNLNDSVPDEDKTWQAYEAAIMASDNAQNNTWLKETQRKRSEYKNLMARLRRSRDDYYHQFIKELVQIAGAVYVEKMNYVRLAAIQSPRVKMQQQMVAPSRLLGFVKKGCINNGIVYAETAPKHSTQSCHQCGYINKVARYTAITCGGCGRVYDTDKNAADNIRRTGLKFSGKTD